MKRLVFLLLAMFVPIAFSMSVASASECSYDEGGSVLGSLENCIPQGSIDSGGDASISSVKDRIIAIADNAIILWSLIAIGGIVYSSFLFIFSNGDDGQAKNARMGIIYSLVGFAAMLLAFPIVNAVINFVFDLE